MFGKSPAFTKCAFTFGAGLITGTVLGSLYAPMTGKRLRSRGTDRLKPVDPHRAADKVRILAQQELMSSLRNCAMVSHSDGVSSSMRCNSVSGTKPSFTDVRTRAVQS